MSNPDLQQRVMAALKTVIDPEMRIDLVTAKMIKKAEVSGRDLDLDVELTTPACPLKDKIEADVRAALSKVEGLGRIQLAFSSRVRQAAAMEGAAALPGVRNIVAVASGKGGVGKSTVAANLALSLARDGARTGLMDADVHGPSLGKMFALPSVQPEARGKRIVPVEVPSGGRTPLKIMTMAFFVDEAQPVIWRGPMLHKVMQQFFHDVDWGELDYLVLDLPPGTGDVQISIAQLVPLTGTVLVTTPQDVAILDVRKAATMFSRVNVPVLGVVENMAAFECPGCKSVHAIFGEGGGEALAKEIGAPFLGSVPIEPLVRIGGDSGRPVVASAPECAAAVALIEVSRRVAGQVSVRASKGGYVMELPVI